VTHGQDPRRGAGDAAALAALARLHEARGDWDGLATVLATQLAAAGPERAALELRLATLDRRQPRSSGRRRCRTTARRWPR
jgi:hypothetical protein